MRVYLLCIALICSVAASCKAAGPPHLQAFLSDHCFDCHRGDEAEGALDLSTLSDDLSTSAFERWVRVFDRVTAGEMPPPDSATVPGEALEKFQVTTKRWLTAHQEQEFLEHGRVRGRRLTNLQLERTLHDLLGIDIPLASLMPEEPRAKEFKTIASGQSISHFHLQTHLDIVDTALAEAFRRAVSKPDEWSKRFSARQVARRNPRRRCREAEMLNGKAVVWSANLPFYGRIPVTTAREAGWYRVRIKASALNPPAKHGVWCTIRTGICESSAPLLSWVGAFEATTEPGEWTFKTWLPRGHMLEVRPGDATLRKGRFDGGQIGTGEGGPQRVPGLATHSLEIQRIHNGPGNAAIWRALFADLNFQVDAAGNKRVSTPAPVKDATRLVKRFAERAFRRPVSAQDLAPYVKVATDALAQNQDVLTAVRRAYRAVLCSPRFLHFHEMPGPLDDYAIASRMSYMLWNSMPDAHLMTLAREGRLQDLGVVRAQVARMLKDQRGRKFVKDLSYEWLELSEIDFTEPDRKLYPGFDMIVQNSMVAETQQFLQHMLDENLSVGNLIDSQFTFLNSRLSRYYGMNGVKGTAVRQVALKPADRRGGLLTQGAIMKVTANGTTTSPVLRGVWVSERLLGVEIPPPPDAVPAIEPDIRGATSIRDMLARHTSDTSCAACHQHIDPPGFALENFDPSGRWRDHYATIKRGRRGRGLPVDVGSKLSDGRVFASLADFQRMVLKDKRGLAANVARKLMAWGTGESCDFADRAVIGRIVAQSADSDFGLKTILQNVVASHTFRSK